MKTIRSLLQTLPAGLSLLTGGQSCLSCGNYAVPSPLCPECQKSRLFVWTPRECRCSCCGRELVSEIGMCTACRRQPLLTHVRQVLPIHSYRLWKRDVLFGWKTAGMRQLSPVLATLMASFLEREFGHLGGRSGRDVPLVPVPPRKGKIREQGWDQVQELCGHLKRSHGFQVLPLLERRSVGQQKKLDRRGRLDNLGKAYAMDERRLKKARLPSRVILVDDILTTGVTMETCARALVQAGVGEVYGCTLFYVP